ncbi:MAG: ABC transporter permease [Elusimicrobiota bacterium]
MIPITSRIFWRQVAALTLANLKSRYRKTLAGFAWVVLNPILMYTVQCYVFRYILRISLPHYGLFLLSGLLPWIFILQSLEMCTPVLVNSGRLLKSFPTNPLVYVFAQLLDNLINFSAAFLIVLAPLWLYENVDPRGLFCLPLAAALLFLGVLAISWLLSVLNVFFRDTRFLVTFSMGVCYYVTPIFYPIEFVPEKIRWLVKLNPFYAMIVPFHAAMLGFSWRSFAGACAGSAAVSAAALPLAGAYWTRKRNEIYLHL